MDIDKTREETLNIALNKITGAWDDSRAGGSLKDIEDSDFGLGKTGLTRLRLNSVQQVHSKRSKEDDFDVESS